MTQANSDDQAQASRERVCVVCGASLINHRPDARHCSPACRVEAHRIAGILRGSYSGPYRSLRERLEAGHKAYKDALVTTQGGPRATVRRSVTNTAIGKLIPDNRVP